MDATTVRTGIGCLMLILLCAASASAQIEDQLSVYTGANAIGYMQPLADAFGADLNASLFHSAEIARIGFHFRLEFPIMGVIFSDDDRTFTAVTEGDFSPEQRVQAPTIIGSGEAKVVTGYGGTSYAFPGGFDLNSFAIAVPQLRIGSVFGTEAILRYFSINTGDVELGDLGLFGFGIRHSVSQYLGPVFPVDIAAGFFWQKFKLGENKDGDDLISVKAFTIGVQASKKFAVFVPYTGLSYDTSSMDVAYVNDSSGAEERIDLDFDSTKTVHWTIGMMIDLIYLNAFAEYNIAGQSSFSFGLGIGFGVGI
ncbi:MAG TPA: DUF6588 family protein [Patescibacteria group bacterium]|nr:DUF6588 family protein [Patescibacteria group bacterium]